MASRSRRKRKQSPQPSQCLFCTQRSIEFQTNERILQEKLNRFCQAFKLTENSLEEKLRSSSFCINCWTLIGKVDYLLRAIQELEVKLNLQKENVLKILKEEININILSPEEGSALNSSYFQLREDIRKRLNCAGRIGPGTLSKEKEPERIAVQVVRTDSGIVETVSTCFEDYFDGDPEVGTDTGHMSSDEEYKPDLDDLGLEEPSLNLLEDPLEIPLSVEIKQEEEIESEVKAGKDLVPTASLDAGSRKLRRKKQLKRKSSQEKSSEKTKRPRKERVRVEKKRRSELYPPKDPTKTIMCPYMNPAVGRCGHAFRDEDHMNAHVRRIHLIKDSVCDACGVSFENKEGVFRHKVLQHNDPYPFICKEKDCGKGFWNDYMRRAHMTTHTGEVPFSCPTCKIGFVLKSAWASHMTKHDETPKFICEECGKPSRSKELLRKHKVWHTEGRNFKCSKCSWSFKTQANLTTHMVVHGEERKHLCPLCGAAFKEKRTLDVHLKNHSTRKKKFGTRNRPMKPPVLEPSGVPDSDPSLVQNAVSSSNNNYQSQNDLDLNSLNKKGV